MIQKYEHTKLTADVHTVSVPAWKVTKEGPYAEDSPRDHGFPGKGMLMYRETASRICCSCPGAISGAALPIPPFPSAPDPLSLALELKKKL